MFRRSMATPKIHLLTLETRLPLLRLLQQILLVQTMLAELFGFIKMTLHCITLISKMGMERAHRLLRSATTVLVLVHMAVASMAIRYCSCILD